MLPLNDLDKPHFARQPDLTDAEAALHDAALMQLVQTGDGRGPWSASVNVNVQFEGPAIHAPDRVSGGLSLVNLPAAIDRIVHGSRVKGWGSMGQPDPFLLRVVGFNPNTSTFKYAVNPGFGRIFDATEAFALTMHLRIALGPDPDKQILETQLDELASIPGEADTARMRASLTKRIPNVILALLRLRDSLALSEHQIAEFQLANNSYVQGRFDLDSLH